MRGSRTDGSAGSDAPAGASLGREAPAVVLLLLLTALCCLPAIDAPFTFDETAGLADNRALRPGAPLAAALAYRFSPDQARPIFFLSLAVNARLFGLSPRSFRAVNLALHLLCGLLVYLLLRRLPRVASAGPALAGTALFLLHPLQAESVIYTWGRSGVLSSIFALASLLFASLAGEGRGGPVGRRAPPWACALVSLALALAAKEEAVVLPLIALLWWTLAEDRPVRSALRGAILLAVPVVIFVLARLLALGAAGRQVYVRSVADNILGQAVVTLRMARLLVLPFGLSVDHAAEVPEPAVGSLAILVCLAALGGTIRLGVAGLPRPAGRGAGTGEAGGRAVAARRLAAGILIAAAGCLLYWAVPLPDLMSERRAYLPMFGAALALAGALAILEPAVGAAPAVPPASRLRAVLPAALVALALAPLLGARARVWSDPRRLWEEAARLAPRKARPLMNLGVLAAARGDRARAGELFDRALTLEPANGETLFNRAKLRLDKGDVGGARADLEAAVAATPGLTRVWINLGIARLRQGDPKGAEEALQTALEIDSGDPRALTNLAEVLRATGRGAEALPLYRRALEADPAYAYAAIRLGVALEAAGDMRGALAAYREGLARGPATAADREAVLKKVEALESALRDAPAPR